MSGRTSCPRPSSVSELEKKVPKHLRCASTFTTSWVVVGTCRATMPLARSKTVRVIVASRWVFMGLLLSIKGTVRLLPPIRLLQRRSAHLLAPLADPFPLAPRLCLRPRRHPPVELTPLNQLRPVIPAITPMVPRLGLGCSSLASALLRFSWVGSWLWWSNFLHVGSTGA